MSGSGTNILEFNLTAQGTYVGTGTFTGTITIDQQAGLCSENGSVPFTSTGTMTAANRNTIQETVSGTVCSPTPTTTHATATYTITGGTGRFATATGSGTSISDGDFSNGFPIVSTYTQDGSISF